MTESQYKANRKYLKEHYQNLTLSYPVGVRDRFKKYASAAGLSLAEFVRVAVAEYVKKHGLDL